MNILSFFLPFGSLWIDIIYNPCLKFHIFFQFSMLLLSNSAFDCCTINSQFRTWCLKSFGFQCKRSDFCFLVLSLLQSMTVHNVYFGEGSDTTGVPTKLLTINCSLRITVHNPATFFGIHVSSSPINLMYSQIAVASGQVKLLTTNFHKKMH